MSVDFLKCALEDYCLHTTPLCQGSNFTLFLLKMTLGWTLMRTRGLLKLSAIFGGDF